MLDERDAAGQPRSLRAGAPIIGAAVLAGLGGWLTYAALDLALRGCDCGGRIYADWIWAPLLAMASLCYALATALAARFAAGRRREARRTRRETIRR